MPNVSPTLRDRIMRSSAPESPLALAELRHPQLATTVRVVNDTSEVIHNGLPYAPIPFRLIWPDDQEEQAPKATLAIDNIGLELTQWVDKSHGGMGATVTFKKILRSNPDYVELAVELELQGIEMTTTEILLTLGHRNLFHRPLVRMHFRPETHPAIF